MSTFIVVPGAWDTPATIEPLLAPMASAGHKVTDSAPASIAALREKWRGKLRTSGRQAYVLTTADTMVPPEAQRAMAASVCADVVEMETDHGPFRDQPARLAELLIGHGSLLVAGSTRRRRPASDAQVMRGAAHDH